MVTKIWIKRKLKRIFKREHLMNKKLLNILLTTLVFLIVFSICYFTLIPRINLKGNQKVIIDYKKDYKESGYKANILGKDITKKVKVKNNIDSNHLGNYKVTYKVKNGIFTKKVVRNVIVKDRKKPSLSVTNADLYICPGSEVVPEKVKAIDNYDGDISSKVKNIIEKNKITYRVNDSSGNLKEVSKKIIYKDIEKPEIKLKGSELIYININDKFTDEGYTVSDNCDSKLDEKVNVEGTVNSNEAGEYIITYSVKDKANNESKITRKVIVNEKIKSGTIYLTFDDGPKDGTTNVILDILKEEGVSATFFVTMQGPDSLIKREYDEGHTVALHTASHNYATIYSSNEAYFDDLYRIQERVKNITGTESKIIRFPGGSSNTISRKYSQGIMTYLTGEVLNRGFKYFDWNVSSGDATNGTVDSNNIYNNVVNNLRKDRANMVLMHDIKPYTRDALRSIIKYGKENGYSFEKITMNTEMITQKVNN